MGRRCGRTDELIGDRTDRSARAYARTTRPHFRRADHPRRASPPRRHAARRLCPDGCLCLVRAVRLCPPRLDRAEKRHGPRPENRPRQHGGHLRQHQPVHAPGGALLHLRAETTAKQAPLRCGNRPGGGAAELRRGVRPTVGLVARLVVARCRRERARCLARRDGCRRLDGRDHTRAKPRPVRGSPQLAAHGGQGAGVPHSAAAPASL